MATLFRPNIKNFQTTSADFREWVQFIFDAFDMAGWVQTGDTGQADPTTIATPTLANDREGYAIWRMDDALATDYPIYVKVTFGSAGAATTPGLFFDFGTGSDGAGNITNLMYREAASSPTISATASTALEDGYASGTPGRIAVSLWIGNNGARYLCFGIERTYDSDQQPNGRGVLFTYTQSGSTNLVCRLLFAEEYAPGSATSATLQLLVAPPNPSPFYEEQWVSVGWVYDGWFNFYSMNWVFLKNSDLQAFSYMTLYEDDCDAEMTFKGMNLLQPSGWASMQTFMRCD